LIPALRPTTVHSVLAGVARLERSMKNLRHQAYSRVVDGRSDENDLRLTYELLQHEIASRFEAVRQSAPEGDLDDSYRPNDPFEAIAIFVQLREVQPHAQLPRGVAFYIRRQLETRDMKRTKRNERAWLEWRNTWMLLFLLEEDDFQSPANTGQERTS
jgi:hypothetical protein